MSDESIGMRAYVMYNNKEYSSEGRVRLMTTLEGIRMESTLHNNDDDGHANTVQLIEWNQIRMIKLHDKMLSVYLLDDKPSRFKLYAPDKGIGKAVYELIVQKHAQHLKADVRPADGASQSFLSRYQKIIAKFIPRSKDKGNIKDNLELLNDRCNQLKQAGVLSGKELREIKRHIHKMNKFLVEANVEPNVSSSAMATPANGSEGNASSLTSKVFRRPSRESLLQACFFEMEALKESTLSLSGAQDLSLDGKSLRRLSQESLANIHSTEMEIHADDTCQVEEAHSQETDVFQVIDNSSHIQADQHDAPEAGQFNLDNADHNEQTEAQVVHESSVQAETSQQEEDKVWAHNVMQNEEEEKEEGKVIDLAQIGCQSINKKEDNVLATKEKSKPSQLKVESTSSKLKESLKARFRKLVKKRIEYYEMLSN